jgi:hypothetical protein
MPRVGGGGDLGSKYSKWKLLYLRNNTTISFYLPELHCQEGAAYKRAVYSHTRYIVSEEDSYGGY